jgi:hypothetical protein
MHLAEEDGACIFCLSFDKKKLKILAGKSWPFQKFSHKRPSIRSAGLLPKTLRQKRGLKFWKALS